MSTVTDNTETNTRTTGTVEVIDLSQLGQGLYTEPVEINPNYDTSAPARPLDEATFDKTGKELGKIVYRALLTRPTADSVDFNGDPRPFISRKTGERKDGKGTYSYWKMNFDVKIIGFADPNSDPTTIAGRAGKFHEESVVSFIKNEGTADAYSELSDLAAALGLFSNVTLAEGQKTVKVDNEQLVAAIGNAIETGQAQIGVTIRWHADYVKGNGKQRGSFKLSGQRNFKFDPATGQHSPVSTTGGRVMVKLDNYSRL